VIDAEKQRPARGLRMIPPEEGHGHPG
jgi:hypothetical protein